MLKKVIEKLQALDAQLSAPGFRAGALIGSAVGTAVVILLWAVL